MPYKRKFPQNKMPYLDDRMMWLRLAAAVSLIGLGGFLLTGCGDKDDVSPAAGDPGQTTPSTPMTGQTMGLDVSGTYVPEEPSMTMLLPVSSTSGSGTSGTASPTIPVAYRGDWAGDVQGCGLPDGIWRFEETKTATGRGVTCEMTGVEAPAGSPSTTLILSCNGEGMTAKEKWELSSPAEGRMNFIRRFEDGGIDGGGTLKLIHCPSVAEVEDVRLHGVDRG